MKINKSIYNNKNNVRMIDLTDFIILKESRIIHDTF